MSSSEKDLWDREEEAEGQAQAAGAPPPEAASESGSELSAPEPAPVEPTSVPTAAGSELARFKATVESPELRQMGEFAQLFVYSGFFANTRKLSQGIVKMLAGKELGIEPFAAMSELHIVDGKITMSANLIAALIKRSRRYFYRIRKHDSTVCQIAFYESPEGEPRNAASWEELGISEFSWDDAKAAGLTSKNNWKSYPKAMLFARAMSQGARWFCPDVFSGSSVYVEGELGDGPLEEMARASGVQLPPPPDGGSVVLTEEAGLVDQETGEIIEAVEPITAEQTKAILQLVHDTESDLPALLLEHLPEGQHTEGAAVALKDLTDKQGRALIAHLNNRLAKQKRERKAEPSPSS